jgi:hypothetical protein
MKNEIKLIGIIVIVAVIGFSFVSCSDGGSGGPGGSAALQGTWKWTNPSPQAGMKNAISITFSGNNFTYIEYEFGGSIDIGKGAYTVNGSTLTLMFDEGFTEVFQFSISGNEATLRQKGADDIVFIKQS